MALHLSICLANSSREEGSLTGSYTGEAFCGQGGWLSTASVPFSICSSSLDLVRLCWVRSSTDTCQALAVTFKTEQGEME